MERIFKYSVYAVILVTVVNIIAIGNKIIFMNDFLSGVFSTAEAYSKVGDVDNLVQYSGYAYVVIFILSVFVVGRWFISIAKFNHSKNIEGLEYSPNSSVWWFFVPIAHWFMPYKVLRENYRASFNQKNWKDINVPGFIKLWWGAWVVANLLSNLSMKMPNENFDQLASVAWIDLLSDSLIITSAYCLLKIYDTIESNQKTFFSSILHKDLAELSESHSQDLSSKTINELKDIAQMKNIKILSRDTKSTIIDKLNSK